MVVKTKYLVIILTIDRNAATWNIEEVKSIRILAEDTGILI
jgi:hypothetical protein